MKTALRVLAATSALILLTGCGARPEEAPTPAEVQAKADKMQAQEQSAAKEWEELTTPITKTLTNGEEVSCLVLSYFDMVDLQCGFGAVESATDSPPSADTEELTTEEKAQEQEVRAEWEERTTPITKTLTNGEEVSCLVLSYFDMIDLECDFGAVKSTVQE